MARSITVGHQHGVASPPHSERGTLRFARSSWGLNRTARRLARSKRKVEKRGVPFKITAVFDLERPLPFAYNWSTNIAASDEEVAIVTDKMNGIFAKRGMTVVSVDVAQSDTDDTYMGIYGKYIALVVVS